MYQKLGQPADMIYRDTLPWFSVLPHGPTPSPSPTAIARAATRAAFIRPRLLPSFLGDPLEGFLGAVGKLLSIGGKIALLIPGAQLIGGGMVMAGAAAEALDAGFTVLNSMADQKKPKPSPLPSTYSPGASPISVAPIEGTMPEAPPPGSPSSPVSYSYAAPGTTGVTGHVFVTCFAPAGVWGDGVWHPGTGLHAYADDPRVSSMFASAPGTSCTVDATGQALVYDPATKNISIGTAADADLVRDEETGGWLYWDSASGTWAPVSVGAVQVGADNSLSYFDGAGWQPLASGAPLSVGSDIFFPSMGGGGAGGYAAGGSGLYKMEPGMGGAAPDKSPYQWTGQNWSPLAPGTIVTDKNANPYLWDGTHMHPSSTLGAGTTGTDALGNGFVWDGSQWVTAAEWAARQQTSPTVASTTGAVPAGSVLAASAGGGLLTGIPTWAWLAGAAVVLYALSGEEKPRRRR